MLLIALAEKPAAVQGTINRSAASNACSVYEEKLALQLMKNAHFPSPKWVTAVLCRSLTQK